MTDILIAFIFGAFVGACLLVAVSCMIVRGDLINDCTGFKNVAPCCLDCPEHDRCPDRCHKTDTIYCVGVLTNDCKGISQTNNQDTQRD